MGVRSDRAPGGNSSFSGRAEEEVVVGVVEGSSSRLVVAGEDSSSLGDSVFEGQEVVVRTHWLESGVWSARVDSGWWGGLRSVGGS